MNQPESTDTTARELGSDIGTDDFNTTTGALSSARHSVINYPQQAGGLATDLLFFAPATKRDSLLALSYNFKKSLQLLEK